MDAFLYAVGKEEGTRWCTVWWGDRWCLILLDNCSISWISLWETTSIDSFHLVSFQWLFLNRNVRIYIYSLKCHCARLVRSFGMLILLCLTLDLSSTLCPAKLWGNICVYKILSKWQITVFAEWHQEHGAVCTKLITSLQWDIKKQSLLPVELFFRSHKSTTKCCNLDRGYKERLYWVCFA